MLAVERCFDSRKKKIILGVVWVLVAIALLGLAYWFGSEVDWEDPRDSGTDETRATVNLTIAFIFLAMLTAVGSFFSFYDTGEEAHTFTYIRGGFGKDFANLMSSLEKTPNQLVEMDEIQLKAIATEVLIKQAQEVLEAEQRDVENFKGLHLPGWKYEYPRDYERAHFSWRFDVMSRFGLTDPSGWGPYFAEANKRLFAKA